MRNIRGMWKVWPFRAVARGMCRLWFADGQGRQDLTGEPTSPLALSARAAKRRCGLRGQGGMPPRHASGASLVSST
jgi:hypothetical protein